MHSKFQNQLSINESFRRALTIRGLLFTCERQQRKSAKATDWWFFRK